MNSSTLYTGIAVVLALLVVSLFFFFPNYLHGISGNSMNGNANPDTQNGGQNQQPSASAQGASAPTTSLRIQDVTVGTGATAQAGDTLVVQYIGKLQDGTVFDQSTNHGDGTFSFTLGAGQVIPGWDQGLVGMKAGGERMLLIPPSLAYGSQAAGPIPANSTLLFDVKLVSVKPASGASAH